VFGECVCARSLRVRNVREAKLLQFCFKEVTFDPYAFIYVVMLLRYCLDVVVSLVAP
jgi:hypothetical protein